MSEKNGKKVSKSRRRALARLYADSSWFRFPRHFLSIMSWEEAGVLAFLMNVAYVCEAEVRYEGWFYCKMERFEKDLYILPRTQTRIVRKLKDRGFIETKMKGHPPKRYFRINYERIEDVIECPIW